MLLLMVVMLYIMLSTATGASSAVRVKAKAKPTLIPHTSQTVPVTIAALAILARINDTKLDSSFWAETARGVTIGRATLAVPDFFRLVITAYPMVSVFFHLHDMLKIANDARTGFKLSTEFRHSTSGQALFLFPVRVYSQTHRHFSPAQECQLVAPPLCVSRPGRPRISSSPRTGTMAAAKPLLGHPRLVQTSSLPTFPVSSEQSKGRLVQPMWVTTANPELQSCAIQ